MASAYEIGEFSQVEAQYRSGNDSELYASLVIKPRLTTAPDDDDDDKQRE